MLRTCLITAALAATATQAAALSCMRPDIARTYQKADESPDLYTIVMGRFTFDEMAMPGHLVPSDGGLTATTVRIPAQFEGQQLGRGGFDTPYRSEVTLDVQCAGPWCGGMASGETVIAFLRHGGDLPVLDVTPCGETVFSNPDAAQIGTAISCIGGGTCAPAG